MSQTSPADHVSGQGPRPAGAGAPQPAADDDIRARVERLAHALVGICGELGSKSQTSAGAAPRTLAADPADPRPATKSYFAWAPGEETRICLLPIRHPELWEIRKKIEGLHWVAQEIDYSADARDWNQRMSGDERHFMKYQFGLFIRFDVDIIDNVETNFAQEVDCMEARAVYAAIVDQEWVHTETYQNQTEAVLTGHERDEVLHAIRTMPIIGKMRAWMRRWLDRAHGIGLRLVAWAGGEGVLLSSSFASIQWLRERNLLPGITQGNTFIARDEGIHYATTCLIVRRYLRPEHRAPQATAESIFGGLVEILDEFVSTALPVDLIGINSRLMRQYVRFQADCVLIDMGYTPMFRCVNPFPFMDKLSLNEVSKTNFFEHTGAQYQSVTNSEWSRLAFDATPDDMSDEEGAAERPAKKPSTLSAETLSQTSGDPSDEGTAIELSGAPKSRAATMRHVQPTTLGWIDLPRASVDDDEAVGIRKHLLQVAGAGGFDHEPVDESGDESGDVSGGESSETPGEESDEVPDEEIDAALGEDSAD